MRMLFKGHSFYQAFGEGRAGAGGARALFYPCHLAVDHLQVIRDKEEGGTGLPRLWRRGENANVNGLRWGVEWVTVPSPLARPDTGVRADNHIVFCPPQRPGCLWGWEEGPRNEGERGSLEDFASCPWHQPI